ncbi:nitrilase-related carbon-nitrogen hydrolase, partial [Priestia megaterium]
MSVKITCLQLDIAFGNPTKNRKYIEQKMTEALKENPDILVLPELWDTAYDLTRLDEIADDEGQQAKQLISQFAKTNEVNIVAGSIAKKTEQGVTNTMYIFDRKGREVSEYSKLHLFKLMDEHLYLEAGTAKNLFTLEQSLCAGVICYDIRFPEWIRVHTSSGAEVL